MHEDSTKMSVNGLAIIFAPCLLRSNKKIQAQETLNQVPKQTRLEPWDFFLSCSLVVLTPVFLQESVQRGVDSTVV